MNRKFIISVLSLVALTGCGETTATTNQTTTEAESTVSETDLLKEALENAKKATALTISGDTTHTYEFPNPMVSKNNNTVEATMSVGFTNSAWTNTTTRKGDGELPYSVSYFKDAGGFLSTEYLKSDNTIGLTPVLNYGVKELFDTFYSNPFTLLSVDDFEEVEGGYQISGDKAAMFVNHLFDEAYTGGTVIFDFTNGQFTTIEGKGFTVNDLLINSSDSFERNKTLSFNMEYSTGAEIAHILVEEEKADNAALKTVFANAESEKFRIANGGSADSYSFLAYFDGESIFASFYVDSGELIMDSLSDFDLLLTPGDDGLLDFKYYDSASSSWIDNDYSETGMYQTRVSYDYLCPDVYGVSANVFDANASKTQFIPSEYALKAIGVNFVTNLYESLNLSTMEGFRHSANKFVVSNVTETSFEFEIGCYDKGNGFEVKSSNFMRFDQIGTCELPFNL